MSSILPLLALVAGIFLLGAISGASGVILGVMAQRYTEGRSLIRRPSRPSLHDPDDPATEPGPEDDGPTNRPSRGFSIGYPPPDLT